MKIYPFQLVLILGLFAVAACGPSTEAEIRQQKKSNAKLADSYINNHLDYVIDKRTGICYARSLTPHLAYTQVNCTDKVKALLVNPTK